MKFTLVSLILLFSSLAAFSQSIPELEKQLREASAGKEKITLNYQLAEAWLKSDARKSIEYAKAAFNKARDLNEANWAAESAYLTSRGYNRISDENNEDVWLGSAIKFAKDANDADLIIKLVDLRSRLAMRTHKDKKAFQVMQDAFDYFSKKGGKGISEMQAQAEIQRQQLEREKRGLEREIASLSGERDVLKKEKVSLSQTAQTLEQEKQTAVQEREMALQAQVLIEEEAVKTRAELADVSEERAKALLVTERQHRLIDSLEAKKSIDSLALGQAQLELKNARLEREQGRYLIYLLGAAALFLVVLAFSFFLRFRANKRSNAMLSKQNKVIEAERERSDDLLHNILPAAVAKELKEHGAATAQKFPEATVLFTDFKNFTQISEQLSPEKLVEELNTCFRAFDHIVSQYADIEKIKTIGDAYLCASGLVHHKTIPKNLVQAALEMQEFLDDHRQEKMKQGELYFEARIGIHTGPVVAGVVGFKKFAYDIWGDTVNIAARMEENCEPGRVNISEATQGLVKYNFECQSRGRFSVKNKGMMEMYYVRKR